MTQYHIGKSQDNCTSCGKEFQDGEEVVSCIFPEEESLGRADVCLDCWDSGKAPRYISSWRRKIEKKAPPKKFDRKAALDLFKVLADSEEARDADTAYILALLLLRKNVFELERTGASEGVSTMVLKLKASGEKYRIPNRELTDERLEQVKDNLESIFEAGESK